MSVHRETTMWSTQLSAAARESLQTIPEEDRKGVLVALGRLTLGPNPPGLPRPYRLRNRPDLIVLRADRYRIAYSVEDAAQVITVIDIVAHDRVRDYPHAPAVA